MISHQAFRAAHATSRAARRGFQASRPKLASPYHYPEGPRSNLPFNPKTRFFFFRYWGFMSRQSVIYSIARTNAQTGAGFAAPFGIACKFQMSSASFHDSLTN